MLPSFFALLKSSAGLFGGFRPPAARQTPVVFFMVSNTTKILHFYLERARGMFFVSFLMSSMEDKSYFLLLLSSSMEEKR